MTDVPETIDPLVVGKDCRTDAIVAGLAESPYAGRISGISEINPPGMLDRCADFKGDVSLVDLDAIVSFAAEVHPELAVIGPEEPLCEGIVDELEEKLGIPTFGPYRSHAQIEGSKSWARELVESCGIPGNPEYRSIRNPQHAKSYLLRLGEYAIKPDGLTGGKGVKVSGVHIQTMQAGIEHAQSLIERDGVVVIEERLDGEEFSLQTITDGESVLHCPLVQDHKRVGEGDNGANTGGMGSYSCADHSLPFLLPEEVKMAKRINELVIKALADRLGRPYRGVLYGGFMATANGLKLIEYNARFGDPEAMNVLSVLQGDLLEICWAGVTGQLDGVKASFAKRATVCKYVVPQGYPDGKGSGDEIVVDELAPLLGEDLRLYWASVNRRNSKVLMTGSRALAIVGIADSIPEAEAKAEDAATLVRGPVKHRPDIGTEQLIDQRIVHMRSLRG